MTETKIDECRMCCCVNTFESEVVCIGCFHDVIEEREKLKIKIFDLEKENLQLAEEIDEMGVEMREMGSRE